MCKRFKALSWDEVLEVIQALEEGMPHTLRFNPAGLRLDAFPRSNVPLIGQADQRLTPLKLPWGFRAPWTKHRIIYNARIETALEQVQGFWREAIDHGRCIVPTLCFYETCATETLMDPKTDKPVKRQYQFDLAEGITYLAAICNKEAFSVMTTQANAIVAPIHRRMPVVLRPEEIDQWLFGDYAALADRSDIPLECHAEAFRPPKTKLQLTLF